MHAIIENFLINKRVEAITAKIDAAEAKSATDEGIGGAAPLVSQELVDSAMADAHVSTTATPAVTVTQAEFEPNRAMRRHAAKNPAPGKKKVRLGGYGRMVQSYFEQKRGLDRDEKRLAKAQRAADATNSYLPQHAA